MVPQVLFSLILANLTNTSYPFSWIRRIHGRLPILRIHTFEYSKSTSYINTPYSSLPIRRIGFGRHILMSLWIDVVADDEVQAIFADKTKRIRKTRKAADGAGDSSHDLNANAIDDEVTFVIRSSMPPPPVLTAAVATNITTDVTSAPVHGSGARKAQPSIFRDFASPSAAKADIAGPSQPVGMIDQLAPPRFFSQLRGMDYEQLLAKFNVRAARQVCFNAKNRMRLEHELRDMQRFEERCAMQANWLEERDPEIDSLKTQLSLKEAKAAEAFRLRGKLRLLRPREPLKSTS
uniref:Uncharacterized protein n=1 Tax=Tanacetum cinerariifolium TaxID=118510 RepID=A0A699GW42_TANCI|nr:hypothetical protein [Tanacetum cinerariifolium]